MIIHIVDYDSDYWNGLKDRLFIGNDYHLAFFSTGHEYIASLNRLQNSGELPHAVICDPDLPDLGAVSFLEKVKMLAPRADIVALSAQGDVALAYDIFQIGIYDYVKKDVQAFERISRALNQLIEKHRLNGQLLRYREQQSTNRIVHHSFIGSLVLGGDVHSLIQKAVDYPNASVSISGETGTGKEVVARTIHYNSIRSSQPFVVLNLESLPAEMHETELFGCEKEAIHLNTQSRYGAIYHAGDGTLFIDEPATMSAVTQVALLKSLRDGKYRRVGGLVDFPMKARIITASSIPLQNEMEAGRFNRELFYLLKGVPIHLPRLQSRRSDIGMMANEFLQRFADENRTQVKMLSSDAKKKLLSYNFPGNIPELRSIIELGVILSSNNVIEEAHIVFNSAYYEPSNPSFLSSEMTLKEYNDQIISHFLQQYDNNVMKVAEKLNIGKSTIYNLLKKKS